MMTTERHRYVSACWTHRVKCTATLVVETRLSRTRRTMKLVNVHVTNFRSVEDSEEFEAG